MAASPAKTAGLSGQPTISAPATSGKTAGLELEHGGGGGDGAGFAGALRDDLARESQPEGKARFR